MDSLGSILKTPRDFLKATSRLYRRPDPRPKTRGAAGPEGFRPRVWPRMRQRVCQKKISKGAFNILPREYFEYSRDLPILGRLQNPHTLCSFQLEALCTSWAHPVHAVSMQLQLSILNHRYPVTVCRVCKLNPSPCMHFLCTIHAASTQMTHCKYALCTLFSGV